MNRLRPGGEDNKKITFFISKSLKVDLREFLISSKKYNLKRKSQWINEAIFLLKRKKDYKERVCSAQGHGEDFVPDRVIMNFDQRFLFSEMLDEVIRYFPRIRSPQSSIIRAAILSRLIGIMRNLE